MPQKLRNLILLLLVIVLIVSSASFGLAAADPFTSESFEDECEHSEHALNEGCCSEHDHGALSEGETGQEKIMGSYSGIQNDNCCNDTNCWFRLDHKENENITPNPAEVGETVTISGELQHYNGQNHSKAAVSLYIDGTEEDMYVTNELGWDETEAFSFNWVGNSPGTYEVDLYVFYYDGGVVGGWHQSWNSSVEVVQSNPQFELSSWSVQPDVVNPNETVTIEGDITNVGNETGDVSAELYINGNYEASNLKTLDPGQTKTFTHTHSESQVGTYDVQISAWCDTKGEVDDTWYSSFEVVEEGGPAEFVLNDWSITPDPAKIDETVTIEGEVENIGGEEGSTYIDLYVDDMDNYKDWKSVTLGSGETEWVTFTGVPETDWNIGSAGIYDVKVEPYDWPQNAWESDFEVIVEGIPQFELSDWSVIPKTVEPTYPVTIEGEITNVGNATGTVYSELYINNTYTDSESNTLDPGQTETFTHTHSESELGTYDVQISAWCDTKDEVDDTWYSSFEVVEEKQPPEFVLNSWSITPDPAGIDEIVTIEGEVENIGEEEGETWIDLYVDDMDSWVEFETVTLGPGETKWVTFTGVPETDWNIGSAGIYDVRVEPYDWPQNAWESDFEVVVEGEPYFSVNGVEATDLIEGEDLEVSATIENTGDESDTQTVEMTSGVGSDSITVTLNADESTVETFIVGTSLGDEGNYTATVASNDDSSQDTFEVLGQSHFAVYGVSANDAVEGDDLQVTATVENTGDVEDTQTVDMSSPLGNDTATI
ncbi:MAG: CARDB domain-containing protein, partial [Candidatus Thermoplasmatota archaeon]